MLIVIHSVNPATLTYAGHIRMVFAVVKCVKVLYIRSPQFPFHCSRHTLARSAESKNADCNLAIRVVSKQSVNKGLCAWECVTFAIISAKHHHAV
nr:MAG TPA: hypothetical protein [Caudoviricetes sp.]